MFPLWNFFIRKHQFTILAIVGLTILGGVSAIVITKESAPEVQIPIGIVSTVLPGGSAEDVERLVTNKLEERLANLSGLDTITSSSQNSVSVITVQFIASADIEKSIQKLRDEVNKAKTDLPSDALDPSVTDVNFADQPIQMISITADVPFAQFAQLADSIKSELQSVTGVSRVDISGVRNREVQVVLKKEQLSRLGISPAEVIGGIAASNASTPVGSLTVSGVEYDIAFKGGFDSVVDFGAIAIPTKAGVVYLRDIATVSDGVEKANSYSRVSADGKPALQAMTLAVYKVRGNDVTKVSAAVRTELDILKKKGGPLDGNTVTITNDAGESVTKDLTHLVRTGLETCLLVLISLLITLGWREAIIASISIPLSFLIAFIGLLATGNTINFVSLFSLILAIGILVDSGIVITEAIHTRFRRSGDVVMAAREALHEYSWPLIAGTVTTVAVFVPLFFISGIVGKFIASIPFTLIFVLMASIIVALGLVPTIAIMFTSKKESALAHKQEEYTEKARAWYTGFLNKILGSKKTQNRFIAGMLIAFVLALALPVTGIVKATFFPQEDGDFIYADIELPQGSALGETDLVARAAEEQLYDDSDIESFVTSVGATSAYGNNPASGARFANITINLPSQHKKTSTEVVENVKDRLATVTGGVIRVGQPSGGPPVGAPILIKFAGHDQAALNSALSAAQAVLGSTPGVTDIDTSNKNSGTELKISIDRAKLAQFGLSPAAVASTLRTAINGTKATAITGGTRNVDVIVMMNLNPNFVDPYDASHVSLDALKQIPIITPTGQSILLGSVITEELAWSNTVITHEARLRQVELTANTTGKTTVAEVVTAFNKGMEGIQMPEGVTMKIGGENEETNKSFIEMFFALIGGLALMFIILVVAFNSFRFTTYLLSVIPLSLIGVIFGLAVTGEPLSFPSLLGVIALAGVIINHAIILMDSIIQRIKLTPDRNFKEIVVESAVSRLRPIVLTTITTVLGMIPLMFAGGLWAPLAFSIFFGLTFAMILTLILIPILVHRWPGNYKRHFHN